jgi:uncharacterized protein Yka (UPF0111/DUF47 family)
MPRRLHTIEQPITQEMRDEIVRLRAEIARANRLLLTAWKRFDDDKSSDAVKISQAAKELEQLYAQESLAERRVRSALAKATSLTGTDLDCLCAASLSKLN